MRAGVITRGGVLRLRRVSLRLVLLAVLVALLMLAGAAAADATTLKVNTTADPALPSAKCSLREAVETVDSPGTKTSCGTADKFFNYILLKAKTYQLSIPPGSGDSAQNCVDGLKSPDQNATGDLCITTNIGLTIVGKGPTTIIEGQPGLDDRLMTVGPQASVALVALDLEGGHAPAGAGDGLLSCGAGDNGGAVYNTGTLTTFVVTIQGNSAGAGGPGIDATGGNGCAGGTGGGLYNEHSSTLKYPGSLTIQDTMFIGNVGGVGGAGGAPPTGSVAGGNGGTGGSGGGIYNDRGDVLITSSSIALNKAGAGGAGGLGGSGGGNGGTGGDGSPGGGIYGSGGSLSITNSTLAGDQAGSGGSGGNGAGGGDGGNGGAGSNGGALNVSDGASGLLNATVASNILGPGGAGGTGASGGSEGTSGTAGGIFIKSSTTADDMTLQNTIMASSVGKNCLGSSSSAIINGGHNLGFGDTSCPAAVNGNPKLKAFADYGGYTGTLALAPGSAAINKVPAKGAHCPPTDQRGVSRPQGSACDIGAFEFAMPKISIYGPRNGAKYKRGSKVLAGYVCSEGGLTNPQITPIKKCTATVTNGKPINTSSLGKKSFRVSAVDLSGNKSSKTVHYTVVRLKTTGGPPCGGASR